MSVQWIQRFAKGSYFDKSTPEIEWSVDELQNIQGNCLQFLSENAFEMQLECTLDCV